MYCALEKKFKPFRLVLTPYINNLCNEYSARCAKDCELVWHNWQQQQWRWLVSHQHEIRNQHSTFRIVSHHGHITQDGCHKVMIKYTAYSWI